MAQIVSPHVLIVPSVSECGYQCDQHAQPSVVMRRAREEAWILACIPCVGVTFDSCEDADVVVPIGRVRVGQFGRILSTSSRGSYKSSIYTEDLLEYNT